MAFDLEVLAQADVVVYAAPTVVEFDGNINPSFITLEFAVLPSPALVEEIREFWLMPGFDVSEDRVALCIWDIRVPETFELYRVAERIAVDLETKYGLKVKRQISAEKVEFGREIKTVQSFLLV